MKFAITILGCILKWNKAFNKLNIKAISYLIIWNRMNIEHPHVIITWIYCTYQFTVKTLYQQSSGIFSTTFKVSIQTTTFWSLWSIYYKWCKYVCIRKYKKFRIYLLVSMAGQDTWVSFWNDHLSHKTCKWCST